METVTRLQILDKDNYISHPTNTLGKNVNPTIALPAMGKKLGRVNSLTLLWQPVSKKENSEFKPVKLRMKILLEGRGWLIYKVTKKKKTETLFYYFYKNKAKQF